MLVFIEENHSQSQALSGMPYLASLAQSYGRTTAYHAETHPSLPNYLALAGGSTFGVHDDSGPSSHPLSGDSVFDQALARGHSAKSYVESMPANCAQSSSGDYAVKHNPWAYFSDARQRANCHRLDVPMGTPSSGALSADIAAGRLPNVGMAVPNLCNDAHDCSLSTADNWLHQWIPRLMAGPDYRAGRLAIVVTFDEDDRNAGNNVATVVISPRTQHVVATSAYDHYSWLRCSDEMVGAPLLRNASTARSLCSAFGL
jgi:acid phosphatase